MTDHDAQTGLPFDTIVSVELSLAQWRVVLDHLMSAPYRDIAAILEAICSQGDRQLLAAQVRAGVPTGPQPLEQPAPTSEVRH